MFVLNNPHFCAQEFHLYMIKPNLGSNFVTIMSDWITVWWSQTWIKCKHVRIYIYIICLDGSDSLKPHVLLVGNHPATNWFNAVFGPFFTPNSQDRDFVVRAVKQNMRVLSTSFRLWWTREGSLRGTLVVGKEDFLRVKRMDEHIWWFCFETWGHLGTPSCWFEPGSWTHHQLRIRGEAAERSCGHERPGVVP